MNSTTQIKPRHKKNYIVAIGASAGGLEAIHEFFDHMPASSTFSFVIVQHLSSDHKSLLVDLVSKHTHMKVFEAAHDMRVQPDCVYIIPNDKLITIAHGKLKLGEKSNVKAPNVAIDHFLFSLAHDKGEEAIAIILSGTGTDGTKGVEEIKEFGGMVIVQDPHTAKFDGMPNSAIASGNADFVLSPSDISKQLFDYVNEEPVKVLEAGKLDSKLLDEVFKAVYNNSGNEFNLYKTPTIIRRIGRRMAEKGIHSLQEYVDFLRSDKVEAGILAQDFLIGVTRFFRDEKAYLALSASIDELLLRKSDGESLKIWVCACSTGQEAYSVAILATECVQRSGKGIDIKVFATDIDEKSIRIAGKNQYPKHLTEEIPEGLFSKYFLSDSNFIRVIPEIRKLVVFAKHDVIKSPPFIKNDIVTCRNMLIYVNNVLQEKILSVFHFSLVHGGVLFLGSSETTSALKDGFTELSGKYRIYQRTGVINYAKHNTYQIGARNSLGDIPPSKKNDFVLTPIEKSIHQLLTKELGYAAVYIDKSYFVQDTSGDYRNFLTLPSDKPGLNILTMLSKEVSIVLNTGLRKAWAEDTVVHLKKIKQSIRETDTLINISIQPPDIDNSMPYTLLLFSMDNTAVLHEKNNPVIGEISLVSQHDHIYELEAELRETRGRLQQVIEEMETSNEELQSTNEEMLSANEELQSSNEELQSLNEELHTLNTEHQLKIKELTDLNDDLDNYFKSTDIAQIFVDEEMFIRKFNPAAIRMVNLIPADIGRSIEQISDNIKAGHLVSDIKSVIQSGKTIEKEVQIKGGDSYLLRIMPYVRLDKKTDGVIVSFVDISKITELSNMINGVFNASLNGIIVFKAIRNKQHSIVDFECISFNDSAARILKKNTEDLLKSRLTEHLTELIELNLLSRYIEVVDKGSTLQSELKLLHTTWVQIVAVKMSDGFAMTITDISQKKSSEQKLKKNYQELLAARENLKMLNLELEDKVKERTKRLTESEMRFNLVSEATNDTIWDWNLADNRIWRSANFGKMFGYRDASQVENVSQFLDIIHPDDRNEVYNSVFAAINNGQDHWTAQYRFLKTDGSYASILDRGNILLDDNKVPYRIVGSMLDISPLVDAEKRLRTSERKFHKIFESNMAGMIFTNLETGRIEAANQVFLDMLGYDMADIKEDNFNWKQLTPPAFAKVSNRAAEMLMKEGFCHPFEKQYIRKDGTIIDVLLGSAILDQHVPHEAVTYVIDISKQKLHEARKEELQRLIVKQQEEFYRIFQKAPALISIRRSKDLLFEFANEGYVEFEGGNTFMGMPLSDDSQFATQEFQQIERKVLQSGEPYIARAYPLQHRDKDSRVLLDRWFDIIINPVFTVEGLIDGISLFGFEVTDLVIAQRTTNALMEKKDEFMSIASHELKTPITSIKGFLQFASRLAERKSFDNIFDFLNKAESQVSKLTRLVDDLLDVTKIQAGKITFSVSHFNIQDVINEAIDGVQGSLKGQEIIADVTDCHISGDRYRIEQVISNLLSNAIKYSPGSKKIEINARCHDNLLRVSVKDQGIGIPKDKAKLIFDRFFRVEESSARFSGLGLGLYISAQIIERHHGNIGVNSEVNEGSEFWFEIPIVYDVADISQ